MSSVGGVALLFLLLVGVVFFILPGLNVCFSGFFSFFFLLFFKLLVIDFYSKYYKSVVGGGFFFSNYGVFNF